MKRHILFTFLILIAFTVYGQKSISPDSVKSTFEAPDFNYPKTVIVKANHNLYKALSSGNEEEVMLAVIQSSLAETMLTSDSLPKVLSSVEKVKAAVSDYCIQASLNLLEAHIINSYYNRNRYRISQRDNLNSPISSDIFQWDTKQFKEKISSLIDEAFKFEHTLKSTPITKYPKFITINKNSISTYPTMYDFIAYRSIAIYNSWGFSNNWNPFLRTTTTDKNYDNKIITIYDNLLTFHAQGSRGYIKALLSKLDFTETNTRQRLDSLYQDFKNSADVAPILLSLTQKITDKREKYSLLKKYLKQYPNSDYCGRVELSLRTLEIPSATITFNNQYTTTDSVRFYCNINNTDKFTVSVYNALGKDNIRKNDISTEKPVYSKDFTLNDTIPFCDTIRIACPPLPYGIYTATIDIYDKNGSVIEQINNYLSTFLVSDITSFSINDNTNKTRKIFAVNAFTGKPYKNVEVTSSLRGNSKDKFREITNSNGFISANDTRFSRFYFSHGDDKHSSSTIYAYFYNQDYDKFYRHANIFTDLAIYRPGETVHMSAVCYQANAVKKELLKHHKVAVTLYDANRDTISSSEFITDEMGNIAHDFVIPENRMNGNFVIEITDSAKHEYYGGRSISVSEYKAPEFYIDFIDTKRTYSISDSIAFKGIAKTFSGMPVAGIRIKCILESAPMFAGFNALADFSTSTDEMGEFYLFIDTKAIKEKETTPFTTYRITATGTNETGDTQSGSTKFNIGSSIVITWDYDSNKCLNINADEKAVIPVNIVSNNEINPDSIPCTLTLRNLSLLTNDTIHFYSGDKKIDFSYIASGEYNMSIWANEDSCSKIKDKKVAVFRNKDKLPPIESALWTPYENLSCVPGKKSSILLGNSFPDSHYYYVINYKDKILGQGWKHLSKGMDEFKYTMPANADEDLVIQLYGVKNLVPFKYDIRIKPEVKKTETILSVEAFRDKITSGENEKWTLHFSHNGKPADKAAIVCALTDKAINTLRNNQWQFNPQLNHFGTIQALTIQNRTQWGGGINRFNWNSDVLNTINELRRSPMIFAPALYLYGQQYFDTAIRMRSANYTRTAPARAEAKPTGNDNGAVEDMFNYIRNSYPEIMETAMTTAAYGSADSMKKESAESEESIAEKQLSNIQIRTSDIKTVFWKPLLTTGNNGNAYIEFTVPDMNSTWQFRAIGYDTHLNTATLLKEVISNKPIMVNSNMPRFLRQGDDVTLMANIQNATDTLQQCLATIELFNPFTNGIYSSKNFNTEVNANGTHRVSIEYTVPDTVSAIAFRIKATNGKFSDGEQVLIPVLQAVNPVIESKPFFIEANEKNYSIELPEIPEGARITFEYCDNPAWYIATALPSIKDNGSTTAIQLAHSIFANLTALKVVADNPQIPAAFDYWERNPQDSALISMLEKNQDLKISSLTASPWVKESEKQTLQMSLMADLFNKEKSSKATNKLIDKLAELQLNDGGFCWFKYPDAVSSTRTTIAVLQIIGKCRTTGSIDNKLEEITSKAIAYLDNSVINRYNTQKDKLSFSGYGDYAYTRSLYLDIPMSVTVKDLYSRITKSLLKEWKKMNVVDKAYTAITLANFGKTIQAKPILESISQFSIYTPEKGRFWDTFRSNTYQYCNKVALTSLILQAYAKITPESKEIDQIRKWLLLEKQTTDWGNSSMAADAVAAILSTGTKWLVTGTAPIFAIDNNPFTMNKLDSILGYGTIQLNISPTAKRKFLSISTESESPAWGAVYCQYNAPIKSIQAASTPELSVTKEILNYNNDSVFKPGDKVQIRLVIKNSRNLEYVTISDERAACMEPAEQLSGYKYSDGTGYYMEVKDTCMRMFFNYMPKGTHVITYDAYLTNTGEFSCGIASVQCQYAPQITAHSAGAQINVK
ncbi:MAG: hypothetical protein IJ328_03280 [Muribaculaceae bacterium]|nr:hypothetical protein [Muribaculaceae bacterium]